jgi:subtilisin family serine protease
MTRRLILSLAAVLAIGACNDQQEPTISNEAAPGVAAGTATATVGVNIVLRTKPNATILADLAKYGTSIETIPQINGVTMMAAADQLPVIKSLSYVKKAGKDVTVSVSPFNRVAESDFTSGFSTWDLDAINVTSGPGSNTRIVSQDGGGVYVGVLDTGLLTTWRDYLPEERIATQYATSFGGGQGNGTIPQEGDKWEHDVNAHGTHVTSTIIGYSFPGLNITGVAPMAKIIPVKVLGQTGSGSSAAVARGIVYIADLKAGPLSGSPVVINMSLGGPEPDPLTEAAIDLAVGRGVIVVASAGNEGTAGMGWPGAFPKVISVAAAGWVREWFPCTLDGTQIIGSWWRNCDVADPNKSANYYITDFSSREKAGQELDVAAPGSWVVGPYQDANMGHLDWFFLGGTSQASPHVAGTVALMLQANHGLTASQAQTILKSTALNLPKGCRNVIDPFIGEFVKTCWGNDADGAGLINAQAAITAAAPAS